MGMNFLHKGVGLALFILPSIFLTPSLILQAADDLSNKSEAIVRFSIESANENSTAHQAELFLVETDSKDTRKIGRIKAFFQKLFKKDRDSNKYAEVVGVSSDPAGDSQAEHIMHDLSPDSRIVKKQDSTLNPSNKKSLGYRIVFTVLRFAGVFSSVYFINKTNEPSSVEFRTLN